MKKQVNLPEPVSFDNQKIIPVDLEREMRTAFLQYSMSVITSRALPDVRDGLKPVHRRILYTMYEENLTHERPFRKSATAVGDVLGRYHPHGDASVYDAIVRMAQPFSLRYVLVDGHGNFGSVDGDAPAAYRYTEARMSRIAGEMTRFLEKETVDFVPNYDNSRKEPSVLPSLFPNLLVNGSSGIAVGMATNIPPHNLTETCNAILCVLDNPEADLRDLMEHIHGPDFPTAAMIYGRAGIRAAFATGRGKVRMRARSELEEGKTKNLLIFTEIPYQVNKGNLVKHISELITNKQLEGLSGCHDESGRNGMRIVCTLKRDATPAVVLKNLYAQTALQSTFAINMIALVDGQPQLLGLRPIIDHYIAHQKEIIRRRTAYDLRKARERMHILEGLKIAVDNIDAVIKTIREAYNDAKERLCERFGLDMIQAEAVVEMRLRRLQGLEIEKLQAEIESLALSIADYEDILAKEERITAIFREELVTLREKYGDARRTEILDDEDEFDIEDLIEQETCIIALTQKGYIKRTVQSEFRAQKRGGKGVAGANLREEDAVRDVIVASTHDDIAFFTNTGRMFTKRGYRIPEAGRNARGTNIANLLELGAGETIVAVLPLVASEEGKNLFFATQNGTIKRTKLGLLKNAARKIGLRALRLDEGDTLIAVRKTSGDDSILLATRGGMLTAFHETECREMGRDARGVRGIKLREDDAVIGFETIQDGADLLTVTELGFGKRTPFEEYKRGGELSHRGGLGVRNQRLSDKTGKIAGVLSVSGEDDVLFITSDGTIIRTPVEHIKTCGRTSQGVILMRPKDGTTVIGLAKTEREVEPTDTTEG